LPCRRCGRGSLNATRAVRLAGALLLGLVLYLYGATSEVAWLFLLAFWIAGFAVAAYLYARWNAGGLRARIEVAGVRPGPASPLAELPEPWLRAGPAQPVFEGDSLTVRLVLETTSGARGPARLRGRLGDSEVSAGAGLVPRSGWRRDVEVPAIRRGPIEAAGWRLEASDPLGLFRHLAPAGDSEVGLGLPLFASFRRPSAHRELEASLAAPRAGAGNELFGVRQYRPGDPLRRIHWRSSARRGELVVREYEPPGLRLLGIFCDPDPSTEAVADQVARIAASEAFDCLRDGGVVVLWAPGCEATSVREGRSLWALLEWLARYPDLPESDEEPPSVADAVSVAGSPEVLGDELYGVRRRGGEVRSWLVGVEGGEEGGEEVPTRCVGLAWPV
jgi:uncharacterized protein (DUF58 family)